MGLGPLEPLLDPTITDILINGHETVFVERNGRLERAQCRFNSDAHLLQIIDRVVSQSVESTSPTRWSMHAWRTGVFNAIIPPSPSMDPWCRFDARCTAHHRGCLGKDGFRTSPVLELLRAAQKSAEHLERRYGVWKDHPLERASGFIPEDQRIVTIEDAAELRLQQRHVSASRRAPTLRAKVASPPRPSATRFEYAPTACRRRDPRSRGRGHAQAMNTGHEGSMSTVHANSARDALSRVETMVGMGMANTSDQRVREVIARALDLIVHLDRLPDGTRRLMSITEVLNMEGQVITTQDIFTFEQSGIDENGRVRGAFQATGVRPKFAEKLARSGIQLPPDLTRFRAEVP